MQEGILASGRVERGSIGAGVKEAAQAIQADLIVIASSSVAGLSELWADTITRKVAADYDGVLLLIPGAES